jgi:hypothetical protein
LFRVACSASNTTAPPASTKPEAKTIRAGHLKSNSLAFEGRRDARLVRNDVSGIYLIYRWISRGGGKGNASSIEPSS